MHIYPNKEVGEPRYAVDLPPDTAHQMIRDGFCLDRLEHLLFTHEDHDHFDPTYLTIRPTIRSNREALPLLTIYGSSSVEKILSERIPNLERVRAVFREVKPFESFKAGDLRVFPLMAGHKGGMALNYVISAGGAKVLLAWDTGRWPEETWEAVGKFRFDAIFMECTVLGPSGEELGGHLTFQVFLEMKNRLRDLGCIRDSTPYIAVHIGDNGGLTHGEACKLAYPHGVTVGFDGFQIDV